MVAVTVVHVCQAPVAGMLTDPVMLVPEELARWNASVTALGAATSKVTVYVLAVATFTVYLNHCPVDVQPRSLPPPNWLALAEWDGQSGPARSSERIRRPVTA